MPFKPPFISCLSKGDLIYGLADAKTCYNIKNGTLEYSHPFQKKGVKISEEIARYSIDIYSVTDFDKKLHEAASLIRKLDVYNETDFHLTIKNHLKYKCILPENSHSHSLEEYLIDSRFRKKMLARKCKAGLYWATHRTPPCTVHFLLDFLELDRVVSSRGRFTEYKDITGMELRWIYRNRFDPKVQQGIQFWHSGSPVSPPWISAQGIYENLWVRLFREHTRFIFELEDDCPDTLSSLFD